MIVFEIYTIVWLHYWTSPLLKTIPWLNFQRPNLGQLNLERPNLEGLFFENDLTFNDWT